MISVLRILFERWAKWRYFHLRHYSLVTCLRALISSKPDNPCTDNRECVVRIRGTFRNKSSCTRGYTAQINISHFFHICTVHPAIFKVFYHQLTHKIFKSVLKFALKLEQLQHVSVWSRSSGSVLWELAKVTMLKHLVNPLTPNDHYSGRTAPLTSKRFILYIYSTNIGIEYFKHGIYSPFFSSSKCSLFHNSNVFGSCTIHVFYTGCDKIKKIPAPKVKIYHCG